MKHLPHREFFRVPGDGSPSDSPDWTLIPGHPDSISQLVLADSLDDVARSGSRTRLIRWQPRTLLPRPTRHDYHEQVLVLEGDLVVGCDDEGGGGESFTPYTFATRPAGIAHGPFTTRTGCLMLEIDTYE